ncbi:GIY-YIG nuclease family protein [Vibrio sp. D404a]|uniref:GIY-YIG nuclease family protein n=1 Tax=unclassified Vibrio TaxID=2614977 RepID=UPI002557BA15|nr:MULTISPECIES: GIY-YIG nuclease family protein [unclassified Vibrio]MDK9737273.1 GIY-YIG nuclease family protein [Vibrio sp. D404a]MDK9798051.1 GIY-YIG nuclease family protein [Vibrio sp. D449a]
MTEKKSDADWVVYLIRTRHNALYCGITNDLSRRFEQHQQGKGAKALKGKGPLLLEWSHKAGSKSDALKVEYAIKQLPKTRKERLVTQQLSVEIKDEAKVYFEPVFKS